MSRRVRNLAITAVAPLAALFLIWGIIDTESPSPPSPPAEELVASTPSETTPERAEVGPLGASLFDRSLPSQWTLAEHPPGDWLGGLGLLVEKGPG